MKTLIDRFGLSSYVKKRPSDVPGSIRKLTVVLRAFTLRPEMLIFDDPTTGLTPALKEELKTVLGEMTYDKLAETTAGMMDSAGKVLEKFPLNIFVG